MRRNTRKLREAERIKRARELRGEIAIITDRLTQLRHTRIRVSVPTENGIRPVWDVNLEDAIMLTNMTRGDMGPKAEGMHIEVISEYTPLVQEMDVSGYCTIDRPHRATECDGEHIDESDA